MNEKRNKFLAEVVGECWHETKEDFLACPKIPPCPYTYSIPNFSTPGGFFKLKDYLESINKLDSFFEWYVAEKRKDYFGISIPCRVEFFKKCMLILLKTPDRFAVTVYKFLIIEKGRETAQQ